MTESQIIQAVSVAGLRDRGWTRKTVETLLGEPDIIVESPRNEKTTRLRFYKLERIEAAERTKAFKQKRRRTAKELEAAWRKDINDRLARRLSEFTVTINREDMQTVRERGQRFYGTREDASVEENTVEYLLVSEGVNYDRTLAGDALAFDCLEIVRAARTKTLEAIADAYPEFAAECARRIAILV